MSSGFSESDLSCLATRSCAGICSLVQPATVTVVSVSMSMACTTSQNHTSEVQCSAAQLESKQHCQRPTNVHMHVLTLAGKHLIQGTWERRRREMMQGCRTCRGDHGACRRKEKGERDVTIANVSK